MSIQGTVTLALGFWNSSHLLEGSQEPGPFPLDILYLPVMMNRKLQYSVGMLQGTGRGHLPHVIALWMVLQSVTAQPLEAPRKSSARRRHQSSVSHLA